MVDYTSDFDVVWSGATANDPDNGNSHGLMLDPRSSDCDVRTPWNHEFMFDEIGLSVAELERGIQRLNASLKKPLDLRGFVAQPSLFGRRAA